MLSDAYLKGYSAAMNGEFRAMPVNLGYQPGSDERNDWYRGYDNAFNPKTAERVALSRSTCDLNNLAG